MRRPPNSFFLCLNWRKYVNRAVINLTDISLNRSRKITEVNLLVDNVLKNSESKFSFGTTVLAAATTECDRWCINMPLLSEPFTTARYYQVVDETKYPNYFVRCKANNDCLTSTRRKQYVDGCADGRQKCLMVSLFGLAIYHFLKKSQFTKRD